MNNADVNFNKITDLINSNNEKEFKAFEAAKNLNTEKKAIDYEPGMISDPRGTSQTGVITFEEIAPYLEKLFTSEERKELDRRFLLYSSDGIMSNRQFWSFLDLQQISNTTFAKLFYKAACDFNDNSKIDHLKFMDRYKFYQFVAIFTKTDEINKNRKNFVKNDSDGFGDDSNSKQNSFATFIPPIIIDPLSGFSSRYSIFISVDFPDPDAPITKTNSPFLILKFKSYKATTPFL